MLLSAAGATGQHVCSSRVSSSRRACKVIASANQQHPHRQKPAQPAQVRLQSAVLAGAASLLLLVGGGSFAPHAQASGYDASSDAADVAWEAKEAIDAEKQQIEYMLGQRDLAKKAMIFEQRQQIRTEVGSIQNSLQQQLTKEKANLLAATKIGDMRLAEAISREAKQLEEKQDKLRSVAGVAETKLARIELLSRARMLSAKKRVAQEAESAKQDVGSQLEGYMGELGGLTTSSMPGMAIN